MTAEKVNDKSRKSFFGRRFFSKINENRKGLIVHSVLELLGLPVVSLIAVIVFYLDNNYINYEYDVPEMFLVIAVISLIISILLGAYFALSTFSYLYRKSLADMNYALPLDSKQRFFADYLAGLTVYFVPVICAVLLSFIIFGIGCLITDLSEVATMIPLFLKAGFIVLVGMLMYYTISVLAITFCGSIFESILSVLLINGIIPATIICTSFIIYSADGYGGTDDSILEKLGFLATSPGGAAAFFFSYFVYRDIGAFLSSLYVKWMIAALLVSAVFLIAAYLLYKHRKAEDISKPYVYKSYFYVMMGAAVFCILSLFFAAEINIFGGILICAIGWFIMEVIRRRGFKRFWTAAIGFAAAVAVTFAIKGISDATEGFGVYKYVPSDSGVEAVTLHISGYHLMLGYDELSFKDKDVIKAVTELHKEAIDRHDNYDSYEYNIVDYDPEARHDQISTYIKYMMKSGSSVTRYYNMNSGMAGELFKSILLSDEYAQLSADMIAYSVVDRYYYYGGRRYRWSELGDLDKGCVLNVYSSLKLGETRIRLSQNDAREFFEGFEEDMKNMTAEDLERGKVYCYISDKWVLDSFTNTIDFLKEHGYTAPEKAWDQGIGFYSEVNFEINAPVKYSFTPWYCFKSDKNVYSYSWGKYMEKIALADKISSVGAYAQYYDTRRSIDLSRIDGNMEEFLSRLTPFVFSEMPLAEVSINDTMFYLPDENDNAQLLEMVMSSIDSFLVEDTEQNYYYDDEYVYDKEVYDGPLTVPVEVESYQ